MSDSAGEPTENAGYDEFLRAIEAGEGFYLECPEGHGTLPPRRVCPHCGATELEERPLPETGTVETYTTVHVSVPDFEAETPYITAIASFGPVRLTGVIWGGDDAAIETGTTVEATIVRNETTGDRTLTLRPR